MKMLDLQAEKQHATVLGWILILEHAVLLLAAAFIWVLLTGIGAASRDPEALAILSLVATIVGLFLAALSIPGIVAGWALLARKWWGRFLALAVAALGLVNVPLGTLIGIYAIFVLMQDSAAVYFERTAPSQSAPSPVMQ
ncbi:MAG: hypothetical protein ACM3JD_04490 [Rudaea sp.]